MRKGKKTLAFALMLAMTLTFTLSACGKKGNADAPEITTAALAAGAVGAVYKETLAASGAAPITWSVDAGSLPAGLALTADTGVIGGAPSAAGAFTFTVKAANSAGENTKQFTLTIAKGEGAAVSAPTLASKTSVSITINAAAASANGQAAEYGISLTDDAAAVTEWQTELTFGGLSNYTQYYIFARSQSGANYGAGPASASLGIKTDKGAQTPPSVPSYTPTSDSIEVANAVNGIEYQVTLATASAPVETAWTEDTLFDNLTPGMAYKLWARKAETGTLNASAPVYAEVDLSKAAQPTAVTVSGANTATYGGGAITLTAAGGDVGAYSFTLVDGNAGTLQDNGNGTATVTITAAGTVTVYATRAGDATYNPRHSVNFEIAVAPKALTLSGFAVQASKVYDGSASVTITNFGTLSGKVGSDDVSFIQTGVTAAAAGKDVGTGVNVAISTIGLSGAKAGNYTLTQPTGHTTNITPKALTLSGFAVQASKAYDGSASVTITNFGTLNGKEGSDDVSVNESGVTATAAGKDVGTGVNVAISTIGLSGAKAGNYTLTQPTGHTTNITPKILARADVTAGTGTKVYDGLTDITLLGSSVKLASLCGSDTVTITLTAELASKNVNASATVNITGWSLGGADADNYALDTAETFDGFTTSANVTKAGLAVTGLAATDRPFNGTTTVDLAGIPVLNAVPGDTVSLTAGSYLTGTVANANVGNDKSVTTSLAIEGADAGNYTLAQPSLAVNITQAVGLAAPTPTFASNTTTAITIGASVPGGGQSVEYAISPASNPGSLSAWQTALTFSSRTAGTKYLVFARVQGNANHTQGSESAALVVETRYTGNNKTTFDFTPASDVYYFNTENYRDGDSVGAPNIDANKTTLGKKWFALSAGGWGNIMLMLQNFTFNAGTKITFIVDYNGSKPGDEISFTHSTNQWTMVTTTVVTESLGGNIYKLTMTRPSSGSRNTISLGNGLGGRTVYITDVRVGNTTTILTPSIWNFDSDGDKDSFRALTGDNTDGDPSYLTIDRTRDPGTSWLKLDMSAGNWGNRWLWLHDNATNFLVSGVKIIFTVDYSATAYGNGSGKEISFYDRWEWDMGPTNFLNTAENLGGGKYRVTMTYSGGSKYICFGQMHSQTGALYITNFSVSY